MNGRFSGPQKAIYEVVLAAQQACLDAVRPGAEFHDYHKTAERVLAQGYIDVGLCRGTLDEVLETGAYKQFYMHRAGHWLGMDVHDAGLYQLKGASQKLVPGMVLTVEPGTYIRPADNVPDDFWDIGIRIEDDVLVTRNGNREPDARRAEDGGRGRGGMPQVSDEAARRRRRRLGGKHRGAPCRAMLHDVVVVGAGPVGSTLALPLAAGDVDVTILDARPVGQTARGDRSLALSHGARLILERLGVWDALSLAPGALTPIVAHRHFAGRRLRTDAARRGTSTAFPRSATSSAIARCRRRSTRRSRARA